jgi:hypothetical protein
VNIFALDKDPRRAAEMHADRHCVKMILESAQMLCTAHWLGWARLLKAPKLKQKQLQQWLYDNVPKDLQPPWKMTHVGHPCTQWTQRVWGNYFWHSRLGLALCDVYTERYGKVHKSLEVHRWLNRHIPPTFETSIENPVGMTPFAICMPDDVKVPDDPVRSYRNYYVVHKARMARWAHSEKPVWFNQNEQETL